MIDVIKEAQKATERLFAIADDKNRRLNLLITDIVKHAQTHRANGNFEESDNLRAILKKHGVKIVNGTSGYKYKEIPENLAGRPIGDYWEFTKG
jgi:cysteinyl-tRNA synthetase